MPCFYSTYLLFTISACLTTGFFTFSRLRHLFCFFPGSSDRFHSQTAYIRLRCFLCGLHSFIWWQKKCFIVISYRKVSSTSVTVIMLAANDLKMIMRDRMLVFVFFIPLLFLVAGAWIIREVTERFFDISPYSCLIMSFVLIQIAVIFGFVYAFLMIDERDENILDALRVVPVSNVVFLTSRLLCASVFSFFYAFLSFFILGLMNISYPAIFLISLTFALLPPVIALIIFTFSGNKVEAIAIFKAVDLFVLFPLMSLFVTGSWKFVFGIFPYFWTIYALEGLLLTGSLNYFCLVLGILLQISLLIGCVYRFSHSE